MAEKKYRIMILEEGSTKEKSFIIKQSILKIILWGLSVGFLIFLFSIIVDFLAVKYFFENRELRERNTQLTHQNQSINELSGELTRLKEFKEKVSLLLGVHKTEIFDDFELPTDTFFYQYSDLDNGLKLLVDEEDKDTLKLIWPVNGLLTHDFDSVKHKGIDIAVKTLTPIRSVEEGVVLSKNIDSILGKTVTIGHTNNIISIYGHNDSILVDVNEQIKRGQVISFSGNSGRSSAPHLHFGLSIKGTYTDPKKYLN